MGVSVSFKFDAESMALFNRGLEEFARESGWSMEYTALYTAAWLCRDTMWYTPPFVPGSWQGTTKAAYDAGKGALMRDINKIFKPMDARSKRTGPGLLLNRLADVLHRVLGKVVLGLVVAAGRVRVPHDFVDHLGVERDGLGVLLRVEVV